MREGKDEGSEGTEEAGEEQKFPRKTLKEFKQQRHLRGRGMP